MVHIISFTHFSTDSNFHLLAQTRKPYAQDNSTRARTQSNGDERRGREPAYILATFIHWVWHSSARTHKLHTHTSTSGYTRQVPWSLHTEAYILPLV